MRTGSGSRRATGWRHGDPARHRLLRPCHPQPGPAAGGAGCGARSALRRQPAAVGSLRPLLCRGAAGQCRRASPSARSASSTTRRATTEEELEILGGLARSVSTALELRRAMQRMRAQARDRWADRPAQPLRPDGGARCGAGAAARLHPAVHRPRRLQAGERPARPCGRRYGAELVAEVLRGSLRQGTWSPGWAATNSACCWPMPRRRSRWPSGCARRWPSGWRGEGYAGHRLDRRAELRQPPRPRPRRRWRPRIR